VPGLVYEDVPAEYVLALTFDGSGNRPTGPIAFHPAFNAS
jgi:predicted N-acetyltransferase YhbS